MEYKLPGGRGMALVTLVLSSCLELRDCETHSLAVAANLGPPPCPGQGRGRGEHPQAEYAVQGVCLALREILRGCGEF